MAIIDFGGVKERVITRKEFTLAKARSVLKNEVIAVIGYGVQGPAQALNMKDNGFNVIVGQATRVQTRLGPRRRRRLGARQEPVRHRERRQEGHDHSNARFRRRPTIDLADDQEAPQTGRCLVFLARLLDHVPQEERRGPAEECRRDHGRPQRVRPERAPQFPVRRGHQLQLCRSSGRHRPRQGRCLAIGIAIGSGYLFPTTFPHETNSDLTGERGVLMGCLAAIMEAQYDVLRAHHHSPSEAFNETVEELTQSLIRLVDEKGMDWMYSNCSATAQRGALDWKPKFK